MWNAMALGLWTASLNAVRVRTALRAECFLQGQVRDITEISIHVQKHNSTHCTLNTCHSIVSHNTTLHRSHNVSTALEHCTRVSSAKATTLQKVHQCMYTQQHAKPRTYHQCLVALHPAP